MVVHIVLEVERYLLLLIMHVDYLCIIIYKHLENECCGEIKPLIGFDDKS